VTRGPVVILFNSVRLKILGQGIPSVVKNMLENRLCLCF